jgi:hypothetical protein
MAWAGLLPGCTLPRNHAVFDRNSWAVFAASLNFAVTADARLGDAIGLINVFNIHCKRRIPSSVTLLMVLAITGGCSRHTEPSPTESPAPDQTATASYGNPAELALVGAAHKNFRPDADFSDELISDVSGEKRVCGKISWRQRSEKYVFSLSQGVNRHPDPDAWQRSCANGWKPGTGY